jgi:hypothetical protein
MLCVGAAGQTCAPTQSVETRCYPHGMTQGPVTPSSESGSLRCVLFRQCWAAEGVLHRFTKLHHQIWCLVSKLANMLWNVIEMVNEN